MTEAPDRRGRRQRSLHCKPEEQALIRGRRGGRARGRSVRRPRLLRPAGQRTSARRPLAGSLATGIVQGHGKVGARRVVGRGID